jgi:hypothetical protein
MPVSNITLIPYGTYDVAITTGGTVNTVNHSPNVGLDSAGLHNTAFAESRPATSFEVTESKYGSSLYNYINALDGDGVVNDNSLNPDLATAQDTIITGSSGSYKCYLRSLAGKCGFANAIGCYFGSNPVQNQTFIILPRCNNLSKVDVLPSMARICIPYQFNGTVGVDSPIDLTKYSYDIPAGTLINFFVLPDAWNTSFGGKTDPLGADIDNFTMPLPTILSHAGSTQVRIHSASDRTISMCQNEIYLCIEDGWTEEKHDNDFNDVILGAHIRRSGDLTSGDQIVAGAIMPGDSYGGPTRRFYMRDLQDEGSYSLESLPSYLASGIDMVAISDKFNTDLSGNSLINVYDFTNNDYFQIMVNSKNELIIDGIGNSASALFFGEGDAWNYVGDVTETRLDRASFFDNICRLYITATVDGAVASSASDTDVFVDDVNVLASMRVRNIANLPNTSTTINYYLAASDSVTNHTPDGYRAGISGDAVMAVAHTGLSGESTLRTEALTYDLLWSIGFTDDYSFTISTPASDYIGVNSFSAPTVPKPSLTSAINKLTFQAMPAISLPHVVQGQLLFG